RCNKRPQSWLITKSGSVGSSIINEHLRAFNGSISRRKTLSSTTAGTHDSTATRPHRSTPLGEWRRTNGLAIVSNSDQPTAPIPEKLEQFTSTRPRHELQIAKDFCESPL